MKKIILKIWLQNLYTSKFLMEISDGTVTPHTMVLRNLQGDPENGFHNIVSKAVSDRLQLSCEYLSMLGVSIKGGQLIFYVLFTTLEIGEVSHLSQLHLNWMSIDDKIVSSLSSKLRAYLESAFEISERMKISSSLVVSKVSDKAIRFLKEKLVNQNELTGWPHYLGRNQIGALSTSLGILSFLHSGLYFPEMPTALKGVKQFQNEDGGWPVKSLIGKSGISVTESTLYVLWALLAAGLGARDQSVVKAVAWLESVQREDGGWGSSGYTIRSKVFPTAFALQILCKIDAQSSTVRSGVAWLQDARNPDGGWGFYPQDSTYSHSSNAHHTAQAVLGLLSAGIDKDSEIVRRGCEFILSQYSESAEEGWESVTEVEYVDNESALDMRHFSTPYCLVALLRSGLPFHRKEIYKSFYRILRNQHTFGYWTNKLVPGQMPIWAIHDSLFAVAEVKEGMVTHLASVSEVVTTKQDLATLQTSIACILNDITEQGMESIFLTQNRWIVVWNSLITVFLIYMGITLGSMHPSSKNFFDSLYSSYLSPIILALIAGVAPFVYQILAEEYKIRRKPRESEES